MIGNNKEIQEKINSGWLKASLIIEVLGKPAEYIEKSLALALDELEKDKKAILINKHIHPSVLVKDTKDIFTTFAEVEIIVSELSKLIEIIFDYMPSSVEIIEPPTINLKLENANAILNDLATRLHQYDAITKQLRLQQEILINKLKSEGKNEREEGQKESKDVSENN